MKILFVWTGVTSYMADCWRSLQAEEDAEIALAAIERRYPDMERRSSPKKTAVLGGEIH